MIQLPALFERTLAAKPGLVESVRVNFERFEPWLEQSGMPFFPGFTDHSPRHINDVLRTAASLISDSSHELLTPDDVAVLCLAILLHDCGMHLTQDAFREIVADSGQPIVSGFGDMPWAQSWSDFLGEASRFGQEQLVAIFGDPEPIRVHALNLNDLGERDCLLVGEFVRRHHTRLAHEIAVRGIRVKSSPALELTGLDDGMRDLAGLVARSHGMGIRDTFAYIKSGYGLLPEHRNVKSPYLMAVLRIADYVQVQSERALKALLSVKELRSPISRQEWRAHFAVRDVSNVHDDPEALYVHAAPGDVRTYLKLVGLFKDIQRELDESWATIGEVYGRIQKLAHLGLTVRRIRSNLDSTEEFAKTVPYLPTRAAFNSSGPDLLRLLVGPLYEYKYEIGIRELIQNAVDACRERQDLGADKPPVAGIDSQEPDVIVEIQEAEDGTGWVTVTDRGVGMTADTVTRYFLVAGASFRNSDLWKRQHMDASGQVRVMRGGRFGVGALAAFLLGQEIKVRTRHISSRESEGIEFNARIDDSTVELRRCAAPTGTSITVWVSDPQIINELRPAPSPRSHSDEESVRLDRWGEVDWFVQKSPRVVCRWNGYNVGRGDPALLELRTPLRGEFHPPSDELVPAPEAMDPSWHALPTPHPYKAVLWRYAPSKRRTQGDSQIELQPADEITVNGIRVQKLGNRWSDFEPVALPEDGRTSSPDYQLSRPSMAIFDPAGVCPINLQRSAVAFSRMGMDAQLAADLLREHLARIRDGVAGKNDCASIAKFLNELKLDRSVVYRGQLVPICASSGGLFLATPKVFADLQIRVLFFVETSKPIPSVPLSGLMEGGEALLFRCEGGGAQADLAWFRGLFVGDSVGWYSRQIGAPLLTRDAVVSAMPSKRWRAVNERGKVAREILSRVSSVKAIAKTHQIVMSGDSVKCEGLVRRVKAILSAFGGDSEITAWALTENQPVAEGTSLLYDIWIKSFGGPFIK